MTHLVCGRRREWTASPRHRTGAWSCRSLSRPASARVCAVDERSENTVNCRAEKGARYSCREYAPQYPLNAQPIWQPFLSRCVWWLALRPCYIHAIYSSRVLERSQHSFVRRCARVCTKGEISSSVPGYICSGLLRMMKHHVKFETCTQR